MDKTEGVRPAAGGGIEGEQEEDKVKQHHAARPYGRGQGRQGKQKHGGECEGRKIFLWLARCTGLLVLFLPLEMQGGEGGLDECRTKPKKDRRGREKRETENAQHPAERTGGPKGQRKHHYKITVRARTDAAQ